MPYSKIIPLRPSALESFAAYIQNAAHKNHQEYFISPMIFNGVASVEEFISKAKKGFDANLKKRRRGRKPKIAANWTIVRWVDGTWLKKEEKAAYASVLRVGDGMECFHDNKLTGASDYNRGESNFTPEGLLRRSRCWHPIKWLRAQMDAVTDRLNIKRKRKGIPEILTMREVRKERRKERNEIDLAEELVKLAKPPRTMSELMASLLSIGCEVTRCNYEKNTISIKKPGAKKAIKLSITDLLADVSEAINQIQQVKPINISNEPSTLTAKVESTGLKPRSQSALKKFKGVYTGTPSLCDPSITPKTKKQKAPTHPTK